MILPTTYLGALLLSIVSMICWGSWANTQKLAGKWRFELFYYDFSIGVLLCAVIAAYTLGSWRSEDLSFSDNLLIAAISVSGLAVAFPVGIGLALVIGVIWNYLLNPQGNPLLLFGGAGLVVAAIIVDAFCFSMYLDAKEQAAQKALTPDPRAKGRPKKRMGAARGIVLSVVAGILMGMFYPMVETA